MRPIVYLIQINKRQFTGVAGTLERHWQLSDVNGSTQRRQARCNHKRLPRPRLSIAHREPRREIVSGACNQPHAGSVTPRQNAEAVMLDFMNSSPTPKTAPLRPCPVFRGDFCR